MGDKFSTRQEYIDHCKDYIMSMDREYIWIYYIRRPAGPPADANAVRRRNIGLPYKMGRGNPFGVIVVGRTNGSYRVGVSLCHHRDSFNRYEGIYRALNNGVVGIPGKALIEKDRREHFIKAHFPPKCHRMMAWVIEKTGELDRRKSR